MEWNLVLDSIYSYENSFKVVINSLIKGLKFPYEVVQFDKNIRFKFSNLQYTNGVIYIDPNINQALHHYLINTRGEFIKYLLDNNKTETNMINLGLLNNIVFPYIATSKYATNFFNTNTLMFEIVQNSLIADRTLLGIANYQYLSKINYILSSENWNQLTETSKFVKLHQYESKIYTEMLELAPGVIQNLKDSKILPENYNNLNVNQITNLYKNILGVLFDMSKNFSYQYDDLDFLSKQINKESICQICYDMKIITHDKKVTVELDGLVVNNDILKNIKLENTKNYNLNDVISKIKNEHELFNVNLKDIENVHTLKLK